ncbi:MAG TPA: TIGR00730 family Rossman fold protein, partial [Candidatus Binatia bacterium]|nr:TIGR00730 family Rossman fold protein [Candidatus Binatia bacterium]
MRRVCVFCGSNVGGRDVYAATARALGAALARAGIGLVYGGGSVGLMGLLADAVLAGGGEVIGVIPRALATREIAHHGLADLRIVESMHERKALMTELADAFVALPGGFGTLEELLEVVTWAQLGLHAKPIAVLNVAGYFDGLIALFEHAIAERFVHPGH